MLAAILSLPSLTSAFPSAYPARTHTIGIAVHHTTGPGWPERVNPGDIKNIDDELAYLMAIHNYHANPQYDPQGNVLKSAWGGLGYHAAAFPSGRWYLSHENLLLQRAGVASRNFEIISVVMVGNFSDKAPGFLQQEGCAEAIAYIIEELGDLSFQGHRDWALPGHGTACPGDAYYQVHDKIAARVRRLLNP